MGNKNTQHDVAVNTSKRIVEVFRNLLREEELRDAYEEVYTRVRAALDLAQAQTERAAKTRKPRRLR